MARILKVEDIRTKVTEVAKAHNIKRVDLFGSYADGRVTRKSDVDLLVDFNDPTMSLFKQFRVQRELERVLGKKVDLIAAPIPKESFLVINKVVPLYGA